MPFTTEAIYQNLVRSVDGGAASVHLEPYPQQDSSRIDERLSEATRLAMRLSSLGRAARTKGGIKVRQPLERALVRLRSHAEAALLDHVADQVKEELNVKELVPFTDATDVAEFRVSADLSKLGPKHGPRTPDVAQALMRMSAGEVARSIEAGNSVEVRYIPGEAGAAGGKGAAAGGREPESVSLLPGEVIVEAEAKPGYSLASDAGYTVAVTTEVGPELALEGLARELVHLVQNMRRSAGFGISDRIVTYYHGPEKLDEVVAKHGGYIRQETLSRELVNAAPGEGAHTESHEVNGLRTILGVKRES